MQQDTTQHSNEFNSFFSGHQGLGQGPIPYQAGPRTFQPHQPYMGYSHPPHGYMPMGNPINTMGNSESTIDTSIYRLEGIMNNIMKQMSTSDDIQRQFIDILNLKLDHVIQTQKYTNTRLDNLEKNNDEFGKSVRELKDNMTNNAHNRHHNNSYHKNKQPPSHKNKQPPSHNHTYKKLNAKRPTSNNKIDNKLSANGTNIFKSSGNSSTPEISMVVQMDEIHPGQNPFTGLGPLGILGSLASSLQKMKGSAEPDDKKSEDKKKEDDEVSEYDSSDEFEDLKVDMQTGKLKDLIDLGTIYPQLVEDAKKKEKEASKKKSGKRSKSAEHIHDDHDNQNDLNDEIEKKLEKSLELEHPLKKLKDYVEKRKLDMLDEESDEESDEDDVDSTLERAKNLLKQFGVQEKYINSLVDDDQEDKEDKEDVDDGEDDGEEDKNDDTTNTDNKILPKSTGRLVNIGQINNIVKKKKTDSETQKSDTKEKPKKKSCPFEYDGKKYAIDLKKLNKLSQPLAKLQSLIGLSEVKEAIVDMVLYFLQNFEKGNDNMLHTVIEGPPGVGKTELGKILAEVYAALGVIESSKFKIARRSDLIGEYLGQTSIKTQKVIDEADGGVLFIDEAYALGHSEKRDSYSKECIDTINQNLSENKKKFICIIAGYQNELDECFFSHNPGLKRRFPFRFSIEGYEPNELKEIFVKKIADSKWSYSGNVEKLLKFFKEHKGEFPHFGGDMENLFVECKFTHSRRIVGGHPKLRRKLSDEDVEKGFKRYTSNKKKKDNSYDFIRDMYI